MIANLGRWTTERIEELLRRAAAIADAGERIDYLSGQFLNTPYKESSLIGNVITPEELVIDLDGMDCMTFIEYIEAMRLSSSYDEFTDHLKMVRYRNGWVTYAFRRHFFTDWVSYSPQSVEDVTTAIGGIKIRKVIKRLNLKSDGTYILPGIGITEREIPFIPLGAIDDSLTGQFRTGDYAGIYSDKDGLDVSHTGIVIKRDGETSLRHASSGKDVYKVTDSELVNYLTGKDGVIIFRPIK